MARSLSNHLNNYGHNGEKCETCGMKYKYCACFLEYTNLEDDLIEYKCQQNYNRISTKIW